MAESNKQHKNVSDALRKTLDRHGYSFQYSVLRQAEELSKQNRSQWVFEVSEFPVDDQGRGTRIDFILRHKKRRLYILAECKRANPALSNWCFAKSPYARPRDLYFHPLPEGIFVETVHTRAHKGRNGLGNIVATGGPTWVQVETLSVSHEIYHVAIETKAGETGDPHGGKDAIEAAVTQVCRGLNGMINLAMTNKWAVIDYDTREAMFLPVIFTTARLFVSDVDLSSASLESGELDPSSLGVREVSWVFYHYNQSPALTHSYRHKSSFDDPGLGSTLYTDYVRTIAFVSASGISEFLSIDLVS